MRTHEDLSFYRDMYALTLELYPVLRAFPVEEKYGLSAQMKRAAVSFLSNVAEGSGRATRGERANSISNACGSAAELDCQLHLSRDLGFMPPALADAFLQRLASIRRRTYLFYRWLKANPSA
jgi:four helix bundle protein